MNKIKKQKDVEHKEAQVQELEAEEDPKIKKKPYRLNVTILHCYKVTDEPNELIFARSQGKDLPETKRMVRERRALSGIKKIFRETKLWI